MTEQKKSHIDHNGNVVLNEGMYSPDYPAQHSNGGRSYTYGFEYRILPLDSPGIKKQRNDRKIGRSKEYDDKLYVGMDVCAYCAADNRVHRGHICNFEFEEDGINIKHVIIIDVDTNEEVEVMPNSVEQILPQRHPEKIRSTKTKWENIFSCNEAEVSLFDDDDDDDDEEMTWETIGDDDMYREIVVDEYHIEPNLEEYWNEKMYNPDLFKINTFSITELSVPFLLSQMWGYDYPDDKVKFGASVRAMIKLYASMTHQQYQKRIDLGLGKHAVRIVNNSLEIGSWKQIWILCQCIKAIHRVRIHTSGFKADASSGYMWNMDTRTRGFQDSIRNFLAYNLRTVPEHMNIDGRTTTLVYHFDQVS